MITSKRVNPESVSPRAFVTKTAEGIEKINVAIEISAEFPIAEFFFESLAAFLAACGRPNPKTAETVSTDTSEKLEIPRPEGPRIWEIRPADSKLAEMDNILP